jgi:lipopolysaccharide/colanic/teichoic acid biosynthesis glycosyltransferase
MNSGGMSTRAHEHYRALPDYTFPVVWWAPLSYSAVQRALDVLVAGTLLALSAPAIVVLATLAVVRRQPLFASALYLGQHGRPMRLWKLRAGRRWPWLQRLPWLLHVLRGQLSLVGPQPEPADHLPCYTPELRRVLAVRPGLISPAQLSQRAAMTLQAPVSAEAEAEYLHIVLPERLWLELDYLARRSLASDLALLWCAVRRAKV